MAHWEVVCCSAGSFAEVFCWIMNWCSPMEDWNHAKVFLCKWPTSVRGHEEKEGFASDMLIEVIHAIDSGEDFQQEGRIVFFVFLAQRSTDCAEDGLSNVANVADAFGDILHGVLVHLGFGI